MRRGVSFRELAQWQVLSDFYAAGGEPVDSETLVARYQNGGEHTYHLKDERWMLVWYRRLPDGGAVGLWTDVSALKHAEAERHLLEARLHHSQRLERSARSPAASRTTSTTRWCRCSPSLQGEGSD